MLLPPPPKYSYSPSRKWLMLRRQQSRKRWRKTFQTRSIDRSPNYSEEWGGVSLDSIYCISALKRFWTRFFVKRNSVWDFYHIIFYLTFQGIPLKAELTGETQTKGKLKRGSVSLQEVCSDIYPWPWISERVMISFFLLVSLLYLHLFIFSSPGHPFDSFLSLLTFQSSGPKKKKKRSKKLWGIPSPR